MNSVLQPLCGVDPMIVLEFSMLVLESCPTQTIELFLSGNIPADLVNSYLKQHAPNMQATYLELMLSMNESSISGNLQNEMVHSHPFRLVKKPKEHERKLNRACLCLFMFVHLYTKAKLMVHERKRKQTNINDQT